MPIERYYTPQKLSEETGLCVSQCRTLISQSPDRLMISRNPESKKPRWAISERGFRALVDANRQKAIVDQNEREEKRNPVKGKRSPKKSRFVPIPGINPDGTLMNSRQLKAAGLWKGA